MIAVSIAGRCGLVRDVDYLGQGMSAAEVAKIATSLLLTAETDMQLDTECKLFAGDMFLVQNMGFVESVATRAG